MLTWKALTHFEDGLLTSTSSIRDNNFFLSQNGNTDLSAELAATITAFFKEPVYQCRFPARKLWLQQTIPNIEFPTVECDEYAQYVDNFQSKSVSVVYASGFLGNPTSMYGHVLLKFNQDVNNNSELLDNTFSYGAKAGDGDSKLTYIYNGITGGYKGRFANQKFHQQSLRYSESELRDLWEYKLNLTPFQIELLLAHLWELEQTDITYYFFRENCAYQLAKLLNVVIEEPLLAPNKTWVIPFDLIIMLNRNNTSQYISDVIYHGSRQEDLYEHYRQLNTDEKKQVELIISLPISETKERLQQTQTLESKKRIIDTLYDYYAFLNAKNDSLTEEQKLKRQLILIERFSLPVGVPDWSAVKKAPPHEGQKSTLLQISPSYNKVLGSGLNLRFRASYYDLLNVNAARVPFSELSAFDISIYKNNQNSAEIRSFTILNVTNLNVSQTSLPEDHSPAWSFSLGYKPDELSCIHCSSPYIGGFYGEGFAITDQMATYIALTEEIQFPFNSNIGLEAGPEVGGVFNITPNWSTVIKAGRRFNLNYMAKNNDYLSWEQRFFNHRDFDVRTSVSLEGGNYEYAINLSTYW
jgi:hypothetical protein